MKILFIINGNLETSRFFIFTKFFYSYHNYIKVGNNKVIDNLFIFAPCKRGFFNFMLRKR